MTTEQGENTQIPLTRRLKFKLLKGKRVRSGSHVRHQSLGSGSHARPKQTTDNEKTIMHFSCKERRKKKRQMTKFGHQKASHVPP
jgi:hypothetical protein